MFLETSPLSVFSADQLERLKQEWVSVISKIGLNKLEEEHWTEVYCKILGIKESGFSNLFGKDIEYQGRVVEMKCIKQEFPFRPRIMHPSLTRRVHEWSTDDPPHISMENVVGGYNKLIKETFGEREARWGLLVYSPTLSHASYFEYPICCLDPRGLTAEYRTKKKSDSRRGTTNLWIYQNGQKIMSVTSQSAGMKIQPYFNVPDVCDNRYDLFMDDLGVPIASSYSYFINKFASELEITPGELIEQSLDIETSNDMPYTSPIFVKSLHVEKLGGLGSQWQSNLLERIALFLQGKKV